MTVTADTIAATTRKGRFGPWLLISLALLLALAWGGLALFSGRALVAPDWLTERVEQRASAALGGAARIEIGGIVAVLGEGRVPRIVLRDLKLVNAVGADVVQIPEIRARLAAESLLGGEFALTRLTVVGASLTVRRDRYGRVDLAFGAESDAFSGIGTLPEVLDAIDRAFDRPLLSRLDTISGEALRLTFQDARTARLWRAENGSLTIRQEEGRRSLALGFVLAGGAGDGPASVRVSLSAPRGGGALDLAADVSNITAADVASQVPALAWLTAADAPLSANFRGRLDAEGTLAGFDGALEIGAGAISPGGLARPIPFEGAKAYISFDPEADRVDFADITATTAEARVRASGHAYLRGIDAVTGLPGQMLIQLGLSEIEVNPEGELSAPARFDNGAADLRLSLSPLKLELGQVVLTGKGTRFSASGEVEALPEGWRVALDAEVDQMAHDRLFALWPLRLTPKTRLWLTRNVIEGVLYDVHAAVRLAPGHEPRIALNYEFRDGTVRFMRTLPPITGGSGYAALLGTRYTMSVGSGEVLAPNGERIDASGSTFTVLDVTQRPATGEIRLKTESSIPAALSLLDEPPFEFLKKAGRSPDLATGRARLSGTIVTPLRPRVRLPDIDLEFTGRLTGVRSETIVPGRVLAADALTLTATDTGLRIGGTGRIGQAGFNAAWSLPFGAGPDAPGRVDGNVVLNQAFLDEFNIGLPRGSVSGQGTGRIEIDLPRGAPPEFRLTSDLERLGLSVQALGWSKGRAATGSLEVAGRLSAPPAIDRIAFSAPGLSAEGRLDLNADGSFEALRLSRVRAGGWLDAPVVLSARGAGRSPAVAVTGGTVDLRRTSFGGGSRGGGGPITLALDRLIVSEGIMFSGLRANLSTSGGLNGRFSGRLAGAAEVSGVLAPSEQGTAVRLIAADAGAVLRASGLLQTARRGTLDLTLVPLPGEGRYDGRVVIRDLGIRGAPALADLLAAISVVGLLEQLNGQGIVFGEVTGEFTLDPRGVTLRRGSAVGPSLGISMSGIYDLRTKSIDMQGTISPIYLVNAIGEIFTRRGEGLFGFNYRMTGPAAAPRTSVNPLSILTPGMFREIFRAAPPRLTQ